MERFEINILGCGSALPTTRHFPTSQVVNVRDKLFMIDCGEGAQLQLRKSQLKFTRLNHLFVSHLHGDHCFGIPGLLSTLALLGRTADFFIHGPQDLEKVFTPLINFFCANISYKVVFVPFDTSQPEKVYEDRSLTVTTIPLKHRMPCCGFLFEEKAGQRHIIRDMIDFYKVPIFQLNRIKNGENFITAEGETIANDRLTKPGQAPRRYAYCSDTIYYPNIISQIQGVDLLFHEATFAQTEQARAKETFHTTAMQAGQIAKDAQVKKLVIGHFSARYDDESILLKEASSLFPHTILAKESLNIII